MPKINRKTFSGAANVHNGVLADVLIALAGGIAKNSAASVADLTDNGGGAAADGTIAVIPLATGTPVAGASCPTKAEIETDFGLVKDALTEVGAKILQVSAKVPAFTPTNSIGGAAADGTIAAITTAITGATAARVSKTGFNAVVNRIRKAVAQLARDVNALATATGQTLLADNSGGVDTFNHTYAALDVSTGTAAVDGTTSVVSAEATATLTACANAVKELSSKLNAITSDTPATPSVIVG